jgi:hypothetical protein
LTGTEIFGVPERSAGTRRRPERKLFSPAGFFCVSANKMFDRFQGGGRANRGECGERWLSGKHPECRLCRYWVCFANGFGKELLGESLLTDV